jgi:predicted metalloendopeptidase
MTKTHKNNINKKNTTLKRKKCILLKLNDKEKELFCKTSQNTYNAFEDKIEDVFKKNHIDFMSTNYNLEKDIIKNLNEATKDKKIKPFNDYYSYINERWIKNYEVESNQKYIVQVDDFRLVQDKVYRELINIVKEFIKNHKHEKIGKCLSNFYEAAKKRNTLDKTQYYCNLVLNQIDEFRKNKNNLWKLLAFINSNEIVNWGAPFVWTLNPDDKNPNIYRCYIDSPKLSLYNLDIYFEDNTDVEYKKKYKKEYFKYLNILFERSFGKNNKFKVEDIFNCEVKIVNALGCNIIKKEDPNNYNLVKTKDALQKYEFDWESFAHELGFDYTPEFFITSNLNYLLCMTQLLLKEWDSEEWRTYWVYLFIRQQQRFDKQGYINYYNFFGKFCKGQEDYVDEEIYPIYTVAYAFNTMLTDEYVKKYSNKQLIQYVNTMAQDLKTVFIRIIKRNSWLQNKTKASALNKLENLKLIVAAPKVLRKDPLLDYSNSDQWGNLLKMSQWRHREAIRLEGKHKIDIPVIDWSEIPLKFVGTQAYVVNAMYTPSENAIYIPLGYIQKPFIDLDERGIEYNLAHMGFTIGHELSHALDDWGSNYDETGKLKNWWTEKDKKKFKEIQRDVIKQYEVFASYDGIKFDAEASIGEDLADISGLTICREYLRDFQLKNEDILPIKKLSFETFFVYFAFQQRQKITKKALEAQLKTNPHPPDKYRCNVPLSRLPTFRTIYNVKKGDKMWWHSTNRVWEN